MKFKNIFITLEQELFDNLEQTIIKHNLHFAQNDNNKIMMDKAVFLIDYIRHQICLRKDKVTFGYINLHSKFLNKYLEKELHKYKTFLTTKGYIKTSPYKIGKSIGYKFSFYEKTGYKKIAKKNYHVYDFISITYEKYLSESIGKCAEIERRKKSANRSTKHLTKWLNEDNIQIDWEAAFKWIDSNNKLNTDQKESYSYAINRIRFENWSYTRSTKDNRLHSNLTNLPSDLRKFLSHNGQKLVSLDIKTSQPYMLAGIFNLLVESKNKVIKLKSKLLSKDVKDQLLIVMNSIILDSLTIIDFKVYINLICKADIYNHIATNLDQEFVKTIANKNEENGYSDNVYNPSKGFAIKKDFKDLRSYCKMLVLEYMYCSNENNLRRLNEVKRIYPNAVNKFIYLFKYCKELEVPKTGKRKRTKKDKIAIDKYKKLFSKFLQQLEAGIILDTITKELSVIYPDMFMITIHDSIAVVEKHKLVVEEFLQNRLFEIFGITAEVKSENW
jgi:hypothetical protein